MEARWALRGAAIAFFLLSGARVAPGAEHIIEMFTTSFLPQSVTIEVGDTVSWEWRRGTHTVTSGTPAGEPGTDDEPGKFFDVVLDEAHPSFSFTVTAANFRAEGFPFFCREHPEQQGFVELSRGEITVRVAVVDNVFNPEVVCIFRGDAVSWEHEPGEDYHTVTSGQSSAQPDAGIIFDEESSDALPVFVYGFELPGTYPYFCRPHEFMRMTGMVYVQERFLRGDATGEGELTITDPIAVLGHLFLGQELRCCDDAFDSDDNGEVNISDPIYLLNFLFLGGSGIPRPHPFPGPDRTEDALRCWE
jgi:plastocyanin